MVATGSILTRIFSFISQRPADEEIIALRANLEEEERIQYLNERLLQGALSIAEDQELKEFLLAQHLMVIAKAQAVLRIKAAAN